MLEKVKLEFNDIGYGSKGSKIAVVIDGKEYYENTIYDGDGGYTAYPEFLDEQLSRLIPNVDIDLITDFVCGVENIKTIGNFMRAQRWWKELCNIEMGTH